MATKYDDFVAIRNSRLAYSLDQETEQEWQLFVTNEQFNRVLRTVLRAVRGNDIEAHKSLWVNGTYGTGKSHASAVIAHLLCDPVEEIRSWVDDRYGGVGDANKAIRDDIYALRREKRLLPVKLEHLGHITHVSELPAEVQTSVMRALQKQGIEITVRTDYDIIIANIESNPVIWDSLIAQNANLKTIVATRDMLVRKLRQQDAGTLRYAREALRNARINVMMEQESLATWLLQVQEELRRRGSHQGLLILWDEFTAVMEDAVGSSALVALQTVAEAFMTAGNDSFLFLISHPSAFNKLNAEETRKTDGRYHRMKYNMEPVSAFKIMSGKLEVSDRPLYDSLSGDFYRRHEGLYRHYASKSGNTQETEGDLRNLYPLHPGTANLATHYATVVGSSSRSVFEFLGDNPAIKQFLATESNFKNHDVITADYLWDYVVEVFREDVTAYGAVTERYNTYEHRVEAQGAAYMAIFKGILLLNAFNNVAADESMTPSEQNIRNLFIGSRYEAEMDTVLQWLNEKGVVQRDPMGVYSVQFTALSMFEIEEIKATLHSVDYRHTWQILRLGDTARNAFGKALKNSCRPYAFDFYSEDTNDSVLRNKIKTARRSTPPSTLYLALFYARNERELLHLREVAQLCAVDGLTGDADLKDVAYVVMETTMGDRAYERFIEYMANHQCAGNHNLHDQAQVHYDNAVGMIKEWMENAQRGNATLYVRERTETISNRHLPSTLKDVVAPLIFPQGPDALELLRLRAPTTFWKPQVSREMVRAFLQQPTREELLQRTGGAMMPVKFLIQDVLDDQLQWKEDVPKEHPLKAVYDYINSTIKNFISHGNTQGAFDFTERFRALVEPPYGLTANYASAAIVAFAMRPWIDKIYDNRTGKPHSVENLSDDVTALLKYWDAGSGANKLVFKLQTPQEGQLCKALTKLFRLQGDVSSMSDVRFAITHTVLEAKGYPLWSLKYLSQDFLTTPPLLTMNDEVKHLIDNIVKICEPETTQQNVQLVKETLELIAGYRADFPNLLNKEGSFRNGFEHYLLSQPEVELQPDEVEAAFAYIKQHLEGCVGYWTEQEVADTLKNWRMADDRRRREEYEKGLPPTGVADRDYPVEGDGGKAEDVGQLKAEIREIKGDPAKAQTKQQLARQRIDNTNSRVRLRAMLNRVIDLGYEQVLDQILND